VFTLLPMSILRQGFSRRLTRPSRLEGVYPVQLLTILFNAEFYIPDTDEFLG